MVQRKGRRGAEVNEKKLTRKKKIYRHTFKDTASTSPRDRTLCLGPVVRHLYISHWSRVYNPLPPFCSYHYLLRALREKVHLSTFLVFLCPLLSLSLSLSLGSFPSFFLLWRYPLFRLALFFFLYVTRQWNSALGVRCVSILVRLDCSIEILEWRNSSHGKERDYNNDISRENRSLRVGDK